MAENVSHLVRGKKKQEMCAKTTCSVGFMLVGLKNFKWFMALSSSAACRIAEHETGLVYQFNGLHWFIVLVGLVGSGGWLIWLFGWSELVVL